MYVPGVIIISLAVALLLNRKIHGLGFFRTAFFLPSVTSAVAVGLVFSWLYAKDNGLLNYIITSLGGQPVNWLGTQWVMTSVVIANIWGAIGEGMIIFLAGLQTVPKEYYEAARVDGASAWKQFVHITLPLITPSIFFQTLISTINAFQAFEYIYMLTRIGNGDSKIPVVVFSIYRNGFYWWNMGGASAQALILALIITSLMAFYFWIERRWVVYE
jgi:multiple sugar transport system permease protein